MANYIPGASQDYIPRIQPFKPDYNFYQNALETKQAQYKVGHDKISNLYGTLLNSEMLREPNKEKRDKFFLQVQNDIQRMSSVDLSLEENVNTAYKVFQPIIDDPNIARDMAWTKNYRNEKQKGEYFRNCLSKECLGKYWKEGDEYLDYLANDFSKSNDDEAMRFQSPRYVPFVNVNERANALIKEFAPNVERVSVQGGYIFKTKNGEPITDELQYFLTGILGNDAQINDVYNVKSTLARKRYISNNAQRAGGEDQAEMEYLNQMIADSKSENIKNYNGAAQILSNLGISSAAYVEFLKRNGYNPISDKEKVIKIQKAKEESGLLEAVMKYYKGNSDEVTHTEDLDRETLRRRVDSAVSSILLSNDMLGAARSYAALHSEIDMKADPYALKAYGAKLDFKYSAALEEVKSKLRKQEEQYQNPLNYMINPVEGYTHNSDATAPVSVLQEEAMGKIEGGYADKIQTSLRNFYEQLAANASDTRDPNKASLAKQAIIRIYGLENLDENRNLIPEFGKTAHFYREESPFHYQKMYANAMAEYEKHGDLYYHDNDAAKNAILTAQSDIANTAKVFGYYDKDIIHNNEAVVTDLIARYKDEEFTDLAHFLLKPNGHTRNRAEFVQALYDNAPIYHRDTKDFYEEAGDAWEHLSELFKENLDNNKNLDIKNINIPGMILSGGGGVGANPVGWNIDMYDPHSLGTMNTISVFKEDFPKAISVLPGDNHTKDDITDTDEEAANLLNRYRDEIFRGNYKDRKALVPMGMMNMQPVAADNRDIMGYTVTLPAEWLESISHRTKNAMEGDAAFLWDNTNKKWKDRGKLSFYIDSKKATSKPAQAVLAPISVETVQMREDGYINLDQFPQGGNLKIKKSGDGYVVSGTYLNAVDGKLIPIPVPPKYQYFDNLHDAVMIMKSNLYQGQVTNQELLSRYRYSQGTIPYEDLLKQINQGQ